MTVHTPVLLQEVIEGLQLKEGDTVVDATINAAGHAAEMAKAIGPRGVLIGIDADPGAIRRARERLGQLPLDLHLYQGNYRKLGEYLENAKAGPVDAFLFDLGLSSDQLETSGRGFSFQKDEPLTMTFSEDGTLTAEEIVNKWEEQSIADIIWGYGGERYAKRIARVICDMRVSTPLTRTGDIVTAVSKAIPRRSRHGKIHFATKTFQALRIAANDELGALREVLPVAWSALARGGRIAIITFHSLEDRIVKQFFIEKRSLGEAELITKKPITASEEEIHENPRVRSAKLRIAQKI